jgi:hypothetical protein
MTYNCDFREAVLAYKQKGHHIQQVCKPSTSQNEPSITGQHKNKKPEPCSQKTGFTQKKN